MAADSNNDEYLTSYPLTEQYIEYMTVIEGDTQEDGIRIQQMQDLNDDIQSIVDKEEYEARQRDPEGTFWRDTRRTHSDDMDDEVRGIQARDRAQRRAEQVRERFQGSEETLRQNYRALQETLCTGRLQRLEAAQ
eukprot:5077515-Amphidinium_carterae.2